MRFFGLMKVKLIFTFMRSILFLFISMMTLAPLFSFSQDCFIQRETDPFTKEIKLTTGFMNLSNAKLSIQADSREIDFFFIISGKDKCFSDAAVASVFFEGTKSKANIRNTGSMNCEGFFHFIFKNQAALPSLLQKLATEKVSSILFTGNDKKETQVIFTALQQNMLSHTATCLINDAKSLLPVQ